MGAKTIPTIDDQPFLSVDQVACILDLSRDAIYDAIARDELAHVRVGKAIRIQTAAIRALAGLED